MAYSTRTILFMAAAIGLVFLVAPAAAAITCSDVTRYLRPCDSYLRSGTGMPPAACCSGASSLARTATSKADRQAACTCVKNAAKRINVKPELAKSLPRNCGISLPFEISPAVDCTKIT
ncbi:hypothetical protein BUALT_Bualt01G0178900 [Buddleja alternifolia]|uniref:Non-specific lipid-transfer protein n=1 Tax=Buddleja alternifolia TaxID=168488 RepID=A0AAV6YGJ8_9LAMI|nr:hypothetical protein BUALT_Bualt01G0178900 [Buddleja alternifolia]